MKSSAAVLYFKFGYIFLASSDADSIPEPASSLIVIGIVIPSFVMPTGWVMLSIPFNADFPTLTAKFLAIFNISGANPNPGNISAGIEASANFSKGSNSSKLTPEFIFATTFAGSSYKNCPAFWIILSPPCDIVSKGSWV